ncbi:glycosyl hydrolase [Prauserella muralis]|uniref:Glycosyl hydrolase n=1 Tax=Prauserella muralis TaxID=588067 RepID=A0A2V4AZY5_9PSEU|nr:glycosyl hydrolase [Prauserella muralis]TWE23019.1 type 1 glutamine amidotransferase [Prauserella muralis]
MRRSSSTSTRSRSPRNRWRFGAAVLALCTGFGGAVTATAAEATQDQTSAETPSVLVFSKTAGYRHGSIPTGIAAIHELGAAHNFTVEATEDAAAFTDDNLSRFDAVIWLSTTGDVLNDAQQAAFERYVGGGGGYVGVHAASDTEYDWPWYGDLVGAYFDSHPHIQEATVHVEDGQHPSTAHLPDQWTRTDEWYNFRDNPRQDVHVLASLDEGSYDVGAGAMGDHPIAWCHENSGGRAWYTGGGHTAESYAEPEFRQHLAGGILYAAGEVAGDCSTPVPCEAAEPAKGYRMLFDGTQRSLERWNQAGPGSFALQRDCSIRSVGGMGLFWFGKEFSAYSLKLDWKMSGDDNSGVFVGFPDPGDDPWVAVNRGYEIQIDATDAPEKTTGAIYDFQSADIAARDAALNPPGEWNSYEIVVRGQKIKVFLNGTQINEFHNTDPNRNLKDGFVGIQNHGDSDDVSFRNIQIKELR